VRGGGGRLRNSLILNGHRLTASDAELVVAFVALAAGELNEDEIADWFRERAERAR
jgi:death-on-curing protein